MKVVQLETESYRGVPDGLYSFTTDSRPAALTVVHAARRAGKTGLLSAIAQAKEAAAPSAPRRPGALRLGAARGSVTVAWQLDESEAEIARTSDVLATCRWTFSDRGESVDAPAGLKKLLGRFDLTEKVSKVYHFGEEVATAARREVPSLATLRSQCIAGPPDKLAWAPAALRDALLAEALAVRGKLREQGMVVEGEAAEAAAKSLRFREAIQAVAPHLRLGPLVDFGAGPEPTFAAAASEHGVPWSDLAGTDRRALALALSAVHLGLANSCILWDAPDRVFGAAGMRTMLDGMRRLLPGAQLIVALDDETEPPAGAHIIGLSHE